MQLAAPRPLIQRLNIFQSMVEPITTEIDFVLRHRIEHERVIRVGGMTQGKDFSALPFHQFQSLLIIRLSRHLFEKTFGVASTKGGRFVLIPSSFACRVRSTRDISAMKAMRNLLRAIALRRRRDASPLPSLLRRSGCEGWKRRRREMFIASN